MADCTGFTPAKIQYLLKERAGVTQAQIADQLGVSTMSVSKIVNFQKTKSVSDRIMRHIARLIDEDHRVVFAGYYGRPPQRSTSKVV